MYLDISRGKSKNKWTLVCVVQEWDGEIERGYVDTGFIVLYCIVLGQESHSWAQ
jgi:hypothetical protein